VINATGYQVGAVSPLGLPKPMRILVDQSVVQEGEISIGSGERNTTVILKSKDLLDLLNPAEIVHVAQS
jgi:Cys-tRNA(Pro)/Cys-tRNA(Cys) deacylase